MIDIQDFEKQLSTSNDNTTSKPVLPPSVLTTAEPDNRFDRACQYAKQFDDAHEGSRNLSAYKHAARLREKFGINQAQTLQIMSDWNMFSCSPPLSDKELKSVIDDVYKYAQKAIGSGYAPLKQDKPSKVIEDFEDVNSENYFCDFVPLAKYNLQDFPIDALPAGLSDYVEAVTKSLNVPADMPGMLSLAAISTACNGRIIIKPKPDWIESANLYITVVMPSATRKSGVFSLLTDPLKAIEQELYEDQRCDIEQNKSEYAILEAQKKDLEKKIVKGTADLDEMYEINRQIVEFQHLCKPTLIVSDVTSEAVSQLLAQNNGRLGIMSAEGGLFAVFAGRYSDNPVNDIFLNGHAGDSVKVVRIGRDNEYIERPALTVGLCIQPTIIENLGHKRLLEDSGLLGRFLFAYPNTESGNGTFHTPEIPESHKLFYDEIIRRIFKLTYQMDEPYNMELTTEAVDVFSKYYNSFEKRLREDGDLYAIASWAGKLRGHILRIAACLEMADCVLLKKDHLPKIGKRNLSNAIRIGEYLIPHAQRVFGLLGMDKDMQLAMRIEQWITQSQKHSFTRRDLFEHVKGASCISTVDDMDGVIRLLIKHGYIRQEVSKKKQGRPSVKFSVNPEIHSQY